MPTRSVALPLLLSLVSSLTAISGFAAPPPAAVKEDPGVAQLRADTRLRKPVTLAWADRPLGDALPLLGKTLGVPLTADRSVADDQVTLFCKERPADETLVLLGRQFGFRWRRKDGGYEFWQDLAGQQREAQLRQEEIYAMMRTASAGMERAAQFNGMTSEARRARQQQIQEEITSGKLPRAQWAGVLEEYLALVAADDPNFTTGSVLARTLTPAHLQLLASGGTVSFSTDDSSLPPPLARQLSRVPPPRQLRLDSSVRAKRVSATFSIQEGGGASMRHPAQYDFIGPRPSLALEVAIDATFVNTEGVQVGQFGGGWSPSTASSPIPDETPPDAPELLQEVELVTQPEAKTIPLSRIVELIHSVTGLPVMSDSFVRARVPLHRLKGKKPLYQMLREIDQSADYHWELRDGTLLFRSPIFFRDRRCEVPLRLRKEWRERLTKQGTFSLDDLAEIATTLNGRQLETLTGFWYWQFEENPAAPPPTVPRSRLPSPPLELVLRREDLRLWKMLNVAQRTAARKGMLPFRQLNGVQQRQALAAFVSPIHNRSSDPPIPPPTPAVLSAGSLSVIAETQRAYAYTKRTATGFEHTFDYDRPPDAAPPTSLRLEEGETQWRFSGVQDRYRFRYFLPDQAEPARAKFLHVNHILEPMR